jgi:predicted transposase YbfD/YdcC
MKKPSALLEQFSRLPDPRTGNAKRHELLDIVVITLCAVICYADSWEDVAAFGRTRKKWLKGFLALPNGIPSHDTFGRVFALLDAKAFEQCLSAWARDAAGVILGKTVAVDGKRLRRSHDRYHGTLALETVSAYLVSSGLVLGQRKVAEGTNEIQAAAELLSLLDLRGCIVTLDALHCQTDRARLIVDKGADYVLALKGNQAGLLERVESLFAEAENSRFTGMRHTRSKTVRKSRGRVETRVCTVISDPTCIEYVDFEGRWRQLKALIRMQRQRAADAAVEVSYYISSCALPAKALSQIIQQHWGIENELHYSLDVTFKEDLSRVRVGNAALNLAAVRRFVFSLLKRETSFKGSLKAKRLSAAWDPDYLLTVLACV